MTIARFHKNQKLIISFTLFIFTFISFFSGATNLASAYAENLKLPLPGQMLVCSSQKSAPVLRALRLDPKSPLDIDFIVDMNDSETLSEEESSDLVNYFLAVLTTPQENIWVNLSPYEEDRIIENSFSQTDMGKELLAQDYILKQISSSLTNPETDLGKLYWQNKGSKKLDLSKIWIMPDQAEILEHETVAVIKSSSLKVQAGTDWQALKSESGSMRRLESNKSALDILLPAISKEINHGENFVKLRQVYSAMILGLWFKKKFEKSFYKHYIDQSKIEGIKMSDREIKKKIYALYREAFDKGAYNIVRKEKAKDAQLIKKNYFSGGFYGDQWEPKTDKFSSSVEMYDLLKEGNNKQLRISLSSAVSEEESGQTLDELDKKLGLIDQDPSIVHRLLPNIDELFSRLGIDLELLDKVRKEKNTKMGAFKEQIILEWTSRDGEINKLIRDNVLNVIKDAEYEYRHHIADRDEYKAALRVKAHEELAELKEAVTNADKREQLAEAADLKEVLLGLRRISSSIDYDTIFYDNPYLESLDQYLYKQVGISGKDIDELMIIFQNTESLHLGDLEDLGNWMSWVLDVVVEERPEDLFAMRRYFRLLFFIILVRSKINFNVPMNDIEQVLDRIPGDIFFYKQNADFKNSADMNTALEHMQSLVPGVMRREKSYVNKKKVDVCSVGVEIVKDYLFGNLSLENFSKILGTRANMVFVKPRVLSAMFNGESGRVNEQLASIVLSLALNNDKKFSEFREYMVGLNNDSAVDFALEGARSRSLFEIKTSRIKKQQLRRWKSAANIDVEKELTYVIFDNKRSKDDFQEFRDQLDVRFLSDYIEQLREFDDQVYKSISTVYYKLLELRGRRFYSYRDFENLNQLGDMLETIYWSAKQKGWDKDNFKILEQFCYEIVKENYNNSSEEELSSEISKQRNKKVEIMVDSLYNPSSKQYFRSTKKHVKVLDTLNILNEIMDVGVEQASYSLSRLLHAEHLDNGKGKAEYLSDQITTLLGFYSQLYTSNVTEEKLALTRFFLWTLFFSIVLDTDRKAREYVIKDFFDEIFEFKPREDDWHLIKESSVFSRYKDWFDTKIKAFHSVLPISFCAEKGYAGMPLNKKRILKYVNELGTHQNIIEKFEEIDETLLEEMNLSALQISNTDAALDGGVDWTGLDIQSSALSESVRVDIDFSRFSGFNYSINSLDDVKSVRDLCAEWIK